MEYANQLEAVFEIIQYILKESSLEQYKDYIGYIILGVGGIVFVSFIISVIKRIRSPKEYIENSVCLEINIQPSGKLFQLLLERVHKLLSEQFKNRLHIAIELLYRKKESSVFLVLPIEVFNSFGQTLLKNIPYRDVSVEREKFIHSFKQNTIGMELELQKDFVFPLNIKPNKGAKSFCRNKEWVFFQIALRPVNDKWLKIVEKYINSLKKGKDIIPQFSGCSSGCFGTVFKFFATIANILTLVIHGTPSKTRNENEATDKMLKNKYKIVKSKMEDFGFESTINVITSDGSTDRAYQIFDRILEVLEENRSEFNALGVKSFHKRISSSLENSLYLVNLDKDKVDIINSSEITSFFSLFK